MPQLSREQSNLKSTTAVSEGKTFRERMVSRFAAHEFVRVKNIDDELFEWQYMPAEGEEESFTDNGAVRVITGREAFTPRYDGKVPGNEQLWAIEPGETEVLRGDNAYLMVEGLYKRVVAKRAIAKTPEQESTKARNFNWTNGIMQEEMIDKILIGKESPQFGGADVSAKSKSN